MDCKYHSCQTSHTCTICNAEFCDKCIYDGKSSALCLNCSAKDLKAKNDLLTFQIKSIIYAKIMQAVYVVLLSLILAFAISYYLFFLLIVPILIVVYGFLKTATYRQQRTENKKLINDINNTTKNAENA